MIVKISKKVYFIITETTLVSITGIYSNTFQNAFQERQEEQEERPAEGQGTSGHQL